MIRRGPKPVLHHLHRNLPQDPEARTRELRRRYNARWRRLNPGYSAAYHRLYRQLYS